MKKNKITVITGHGKLVSKGKVEVDNEGVKEIHEAKHIILATGARSRELPNVKIDGKKVVGYRAAMVLPEMPKSMIVIGSGAIGSEFAYFYNAMGTKVTMVEFMPNILPLEDVIHETIMPMLDYESRIVFNQCFVPRERYISRFSKDDIVRHELYVISKFLKYKVDTIENVTAPTVALQFKKKSQLLLHLLHCFDPENRNLLLLKFSPAFHEAVIQKLTNLSYLNSDDMRGASRYFRQKIVDLARKLLPHIQTIVPISMQNGLSPICVNGF
jgi:hypothetical protein